MRGGGSVLGSRDSVCSPKNNSLIGKKNNECLNMLEFAKISKIIAKINHYLNKYNIYTLIIISKFARRRLSRMFKARGCVSKDYVADDLGRFFSCCSFFVAQNS